MSYKILAINPGSTSTKIAVYSEGRAVYTKTFSHSAEELSHFQRVADQYESRKELILAELAEAGIDVHSFDAVIGRGGILRPVE
ncbi:MAG: butyrate kinase, partial [Muribaculaceae bacterium]|nr:butyrate kinase [Muribaculaceae bacterium]